MEYQSDREMLQKALVALEMEAKGRSEPHNRLIPVIWAITEHLKQSPMIVSPECAERGCMGHDDRVDGPGVVISPSAAKQSLG